MSRCEIIIADVLDGLAQLETESVQTVVTSPPYYGLRDYQVEGQIGLEKTPQEYIAKMVDVFREVRRVMRKDGTVWLNLGDSYATGPGKGAMGTGKHSDWQNTILETRAAPSGTIKPKDLCMMPARVALALQADGWWLRSDIIWAKPNPMPESVTDRPTSAYEHVFLLTKSAKYFYDAEAVREKSEEPGRIRSDRFGGANGHLVRHGEQSVFDTRRGHATGTINYGDRDGEANGASSRHGTALEAEAPRGMRNLRNVWAIPTEAFPEAHFATFPRALVRPCVLAGTSEKGCCAECGSPWVREVEKTVGETTGGHKGRGFVDVKGVRNMQDMTPCRMITETLGWSPSCRCGAETVPCTVLDCFMGSGTTGCVALEYGRRFVGIELSEEYVEIANRRLAPYLAQELLPI